MNGRKNRIAIISRREALAEFFLLEARACGCVARIMGEPPATLLEFERVVLDASVGSCVSDHSGCLVAAVLTDPKVPVPLACDEIWEWPISVDTVRAFFEGSVTESPNQREVDDPVIHLLSHEKRELLYRNQKITLTPHEWSILLALGHAGQEAVSRKKLREILGDENGNMADVYIHHLRRKLEGSFGIKIIHTVRSHGYRMDVLLTDHSEESK